MTTDQKKDALLALAERIRSHEDCWLFPPQHPIKGFMGTDPIFIVGKFAQYEADMRRAIGMPSEDLQSQKLCEAVQGILAGAAKRRWTLRADNHGHHHGIVRLSQPSKTD